MRNIVILAFLIQLIFTQNVFYWGSSNSGNWGTGSNWLILQNGNLVISNIYPGQTSSQDSVYVTNSGSYTITQNINAGITISNLTMNSTGTPVLLINSNSLTGK